MQVIVCSYCNVVKGQLVSIRSFLCVQHYSLVIQSFAMADTIKQFLSIDYCFWQGQLESPSLDKISYEASEGHCTRFLITLRQTSLL